MFFIPIVGIIRAPVEPSDDPSVLRVGIGLNYASVDPDMITTVNVSCPTTLLPIRRIFRVNGNDLGVGDEVFSHSIDSIMTQCYIYSCSVNNGSFTDSAISMVCFEGTMPCFDVVKFKLIL